MVTDLPDSQPLRLSFSFDATSPVEVLPRANAYLAGQVGQPRVEKLLVRRADGKELKILAVEPDVADLVTVSWRPAHPEDAENPRGLVPNEGDIWLEVAAAANAPAGRRAGTITIRTNHPQAQKFELPYTMTLQARIEPRPAEVRLWLSEGNAAGRQTVFRLSSTIAKPFAITGMEVTGPQLFEVTEASTGEQQHHNISVALKDDAKTGDGALPVQAELRIATSDPELPLVVVPIVLSAAHPSGRAVPPPRIVMPRPTGTPAIDGS